MFFLRCPRLILRRRILYFNRAVFTVISFNVFVLYEYRKEGYDHDSNQYLLGLL